MKKIKIVLKRQNVQTKKIYEDIVEYDEDILSLDLSFKSLIEIPKGLEQFKNLEILYLHDNQISKIQFLTADGKPFNKNHLIHLKALVLNNNKITKIENLNKNINLTHLSFIKNQINKIENLDKNINLTNLFLEYNKITKIENIHHFNKLKLFYLFNSNQRENVEENFKISLSNKEIELKEIQIQKQIKEELLKQEKQRQEKEYFDNNFDKIKQQFIKSNKSNDNDLLI